jgi:hypothetical protein
MYNTFMRDNINPIFEELFEIFIDTLDCDHTNWVCVDGEEGDYGKVTYSKNGIVIYSLESTGGDNDWYEFTDVGKIIIMKMLVEKLNMTISELCLK